MRYFILIFLFAIYLSAEKKVALLIGNTEYQFKPLSNPINDVRAIKKTLIEIGFKEEDIIVLENALREETIQTLFSFRKKAINSKIAFVYFSGHGIQINHQNYLFPANSTAKTSLDRLKLIELNSFIDSTSNAKYGIVLIDACRNNPLTENFQSRGYKGSITKGLGQINHSNLPQAIIGFATKAGSVADDGRGNNSPYAKALVKNLKLNIDIRRILSQVGKDVYNSTKNNPIPQKPDYIDDMLGSDGVCLTGICGGNIESTKDPPKIINLNIIGKLMYQKTPSIKKFSWSEAKKYCENLKLKGYLDWNLPTKKELSIILKHQIIKQRDTHLWTREELKGSMVWAVDIDENNWYKSETPDSWRNPSLCVRKIQKGEKK